MKLKELLTEKQYKVVSARWKSQEKPSKLKSIFKNFLRIIRNPLEITILVYCLIFEFYPNAGFLVIAWNWISTILVFGALGFIYIIKIIVANSSAERLKDKLKELHLSQSILESFLLPHRKFLNKYNEVLHICIIVIIGLAGYYIQSAFLGVFAIINWVLDVDMESTMCKYLEEIDAE